MYCLRCRRVRDAEHITTATFKNGRLMRRGQCITCGKTNTKIVKKGLVEVLLILLNNLPFEMHLPGHNFTGPETKLYKRWNSDGTQSNGLCR